MSAHEITLTRFKSLSLLIALLFGFSAAADAQSEKSAAWRIERINELVEAVWLDYDLKPSQEATDGEWCRRVFLDLIGRIPSVEELDAFLQDRSERKRGKLVDRLLNDDEYTLEFARNWTTIWTNLLIGRTGGNANNSLISRRGMQKYLRDSFARNKPFDKFASELITATGKTEPGAEGFNGAVNFLIDKVNAENATQATAVSSRLFLGLQVQCTQCHNHPFNDWKQQKYWEMNAFFRQVRAFRGGMRRMDDGPAELADQDYGGEGRGRNFQKPPIFFEMRNGEMRVAYPVFIDGTEIDPSGYVKAVNRREEFARLTVASDYFPKALANRLWAHFLGYGFTTPVDDLGPHNPPSNPELLGFLAEEFRDTGFDFRQLLTWIVLSKPYGLSSKVGKFNQGDDPLLGEFPKFSRFYLRQMRAEELYESLQVATQAGQSRENYDQQEQLKNRWLQQFSQAFGTDEGDETTSFNGTIPQVLMMFNGEMIRNATFSKDNMIKQLAASNMSFKQQVTYLFKSGLSRRPKRDEMQMASEFLNIYEGNSYRALQDVWWVILNSNEFIFNH